MNYSAQLQTVNDITVTSLRLRVTGLCVSNSPGTDEFPAQMANNAENVSIWWRRHELRGQINQPRGRQMFEQFNEFD